MEAVVAATRNGALALRAEGEIGTVQPGMRADLLVVDGDPLADIRILQDRSRIAEIISRGRRIDTTPVPERRRYSGEQVRVLAGCPITRTLVLDDEQLRRLAQV